MMSPRAQYAVTNLIQDKGFWITYQIVNQLVNVAFRTICATYASAIRKFVWHVWNQRRKTCWMTSIGVGWLPSDIIGRSRMSKRGADETLPTITGHMVLCLLHGISLVVE